MKGIYALKLFSCRKGAYNIVTVEYLFCVVFGVKFAQKPTFFPPCDRKKIKMTQAKRFS